MRLRIRISPEGLGRWLVAGLCFILILSLGLLPARAQNALRLAGKVLVVEVAGLRQPEAVNRMHSLELRLRDSAGAPVENAEFHVSGHRKYAPNELPTAPVVTHLGGGAYRLDGLRFHMAGEWNLSLDVRVQDRNDTFVLDLVVK